MQEFGEFYDVIDAAAAFGVTGDDDAEMPGGEGFGVHGGGEDDFFVLEGGGEFAEGDEGGVAVGAGDDDGAADGGFHAERMGLVEDGPEQGAGEIGGHGAVVRAEGDVLLEDGQGGDLRRGEGDGGGGGGDGDGAGGGGEAGGRDEEGEEKQGF